MKQPPHTKAGLRESLLQSLPPIVPRHKIRTYLGDLFSEAYLANLDSAGLGPRRVKFGRKASYMRDDLVAWLLNRLEVEEGDMSDE